MTTLNLQETHTRRVEWVQSSIMGLFDLPHRPEKYNTPEKWESTISLLMSTSARDFDAKKNPHRRQCLKPPPTTPSQSRQQPSELPSLSSS